MPTIFGFLSAQRSFGLSGDGVCTGSEVAVLNHLIDTGAIELVDLAVVETHERQMPHLQEAIDALRERIRSEGLERKIRLDWY